MYGYATTAGVMNEYLSEIFGVKKREWDANPTTN